MARKPDPSPRPGTQAEELALWQKTMADAKPLRKPAKTKPAEPSSKPPSDTSTANQAAQRRAAAAPALTPPPIDADRLDAGRRSTIPGVDRRTADRLRQGRRPVEGRLDLHGMTQEAAHAALRRFVAAAVRDGKRCVLVITGKGSSRRDDEGSVMPVRTGGILREAVPRWLADPGLRPHIVALHPAAPQHGGDGALYLLLRRRRELP